VPQSAASNEEENMPIEFQDLDDESVHDEFQNWRSRNSAGYFINIRSQKSMMLHRSTCPHPGDSEWSTADQPGLGKPDQVSKGLLHGRCDARSLDGAVRRRRRPGAMPPLSPGLEGSPQMPACFSVARVTRRDRTRHSRSSARATLRLTDGRATADEDGE
jgi:hypothetical protein